MALRAARAANPTFAHLCREFECEVWVQMARAPPATRLRPPRRMPLPLYADQERLVLRAAAEHDETLRACACALVFDLVRHVSSDDAAFAGVESPGSLPIDFKDQAPVGDEQKLLGTRMQMPGRDGARAKVGADDDRLLHHLPLAIEVLAQELIEFRRRLLGLRLRQLQQRRQRQSNTRQSQKFATNDTHDDSSLGTELCAALSPARPRPQGRQPCSHAERPSEQVTCP